MTQEELAERMSRALGALVAYSDADPQDALVDLLTDLRHLCGHGSVVDTYGDCVTFDADFGDAVETSENHFTSEVLE